MTDVDPDDYKALVCARQCRLRIPGKHRNSDSAWDILEAMSATKH